LVGWPVEKMKPKLISFDAAGTLINVNWNAGRFAVDCAEAAGMEIDRQVAQETYERMLYSRWGTYKQLNLTRDPGVCDAFWHELTREWSVAIGHGDSMVPKVIEIAHEKMYGPGQVQFTLFDDAIPCLQKLQANGSRMVITSNWDYSLRRFTKLLNLEPFFETIFVSLEEGPEKPDPALFEIVANRSGVERSEVLHVGDDPLDDFQGPRNAGMQSALLDRSRNVSEEPIYANLTDFAEAVLACE
jgi:putative hydrolase of the HAD superfamily